MINIEITSMINNKVMMEMNNIKPKDRSERVKRFI